MPIHGYFSRRRPYWPLIMVKFFHYQMERSQYIPFVIDTGADKTFISPDFQKALTLPKKVYNEYPVEIATLAGYMNFNCVDDCQLSFTSKSGLTYEVSPLRILFAKSPKLLRGNAVIPSVIGRDVLNKLSLAYCKQHEYLFLTNRFNDYYNSLSEEFPA